MIGSVPERKNVVIQGKGSQPMLFAHGFECDQNMWRFVTPACQDDYRVVLFDYVGSGKSDWSAYGSQRYSTLDGYARDVMMMLQNTCCSRAESPITQQSSASFSKIIATRLLVPSLRTISSVSLSRL